MKTIVRKARFLSELLTCGLEEKGIFSSSSRILFSSGFSTRFNSTAGVGGEERMYTPR